jgi:hypothetical protein
MSRPAAPRGMRAEFRETEHPHPQGTEAEKVNVGVPHVPLAIPVRNGSIGSQRRQWRASRYDLLIAQTRRRGDLVAKSPGIARMSVKNAHVWNAPC